jgi:ATP-binding cassette subfamily B protein
VLFILLSNIFGVYPPRVIRDAINLVGDQMKVHQLHSGFAAQDLVRSEITYSVILFAVVVVVLSAIRGLFLFFMRQTIIVMSRKVEYDLRNDLYEHYQKLTLSFYRRNQTGDLMARITEDISRVRMYLGPGIMYTLNTVSLAAITITAMAMVNPQLTLITIAPLPVLAFAIYYVESIVNRRSDRIQQQLSKLSSFTQEIFSGIRVTKAYAREEAFSERFTAESEDYKRKSMKLVRVNALFFPVVLLLVGLSSALTVWVGSEKVIQGSLTVGNIAEFIIYVNLLTWPIISLGWVTTLIQRAAASQARINELLAERPEMSFPESSPEVREAHLVFDKVSYTYPHTGIKALDDVSLELKPGQKLGILGHTGSGKSTLCNVIPRLLDPESGSLSLDGRPLKEYSKDALRSAIGYAPQDVFLFSESIRDNIAFGMPGADDASVEQAAKDAGVHENINDFPQKYQTIVGERGVTLSGGQKQRIALARAWIRKPKVLILDDSLSAVDTKTEELILARLRQFRHDHPETSIIMVSHRISTLQDSDQVLVMENGRVIERGTHAELLAAGGYYTRIHRKQLLEEEMKEKV